MVSKVHYFKMLPPFKVMNIRFVFWLILVTKKLIINVVLMNLSITNGGYAFLMDLMFSMSLWKDFQLLQILNNLSI